MVEVNDESELPSNGLRSDEEYDSMIDNGTDDSDSDTEKLKDAEKKTPQKNKRKIIENDDAVLPKKKGKSDKDLYNPPTVDELNQLRETENIFHSNLFRLQIEEILSQVKIKEKYFKLFDAWFVQLKECINSIEETEEFKLSNEKPLKKLKTKIPLPDSSRETKGTYRFLKPSKISVIGSYPCKSFIGPKINVDVMVEMSAESFQKLDYQNHRYFRKRAIYLSFIASKIGSEIAVEKKFADLGHSSKPILKIVPVGKLSKHVTVRLHVAAQEGSFKLGRFSPEKNNVRTGWYFGEENAEDDCAVPTPHYNSSILHDLTMAQNNSRIFKAISEYPSLRDGIILLKIWLKQRHVDEGYGAFNGHVLSMYILYLLQNRKLNTIMSSYQVVRNVWNCLAQSDWSTSGITLCQDEVGAPKMSDHHDHYECVFVDTTGFHNLAANISSETFHWVRNQAELAVKCLDSVHINSFQVLFMVEVQFYKAFDHVICFHDSSSLDSLIEKHSPRAVKLDFGSNKRVQAAKLLISLLKQGLGNRVSQLAISLDHGNEWEPTADCPGVHRKLYIGLQLNPEFCFSMVVKGPQANLPEAEQFRMFWGEKSELRRFQDGLVCEAVVWGKGRTLAAKRAVCKKIVLYLMLNRFNIRRDQFLYVADQMEELLELKKVKLTKFPYGTGEEGTLQVLKVFNDLEKQLSLLTDLPLTVTGVQGYSAVFRYTDIFPPLATVHRGGQKITKNGKNCLLLREKNLGMTPRYVPAMKATIQLSLSGKWPDELEAVRKVKAAFHIQIAEKLREQYGLKTQGGYPYLDVMKEGFVFRLSVAHQKEIALMKQQVGEDGVIRYRDNEESTELEKNIFHLPKLTSALHGLHSQQPSFGPACCLAKRWLSAQLLDNSHIPDVVVELILAAMYLAPEPHKPAQLPQVAFLRFLELLVRSHWGTDPLIVNFNNEMSRQEIVEIENTFTTNRSTLPPLFIATPYDQQKSLFTKKAPSLVILNRITTLARESLKIVEQQINNDALLNCKLIFRPPLSEYDCLIKLKPLLNPRRIQAVDLSDDHPTVDWHPYKSHSEQKIPVVDFNPVQLYLQELREGYDEFALFFHDTYGGNIIGVLLKPHALEAMDFKVSHVNCRKINVDGKLVLNVSAMIEDFYVLGKGVVKNIEIQSKRISIG